MENVADMTIEPEFVEVFLKHKEKPCFRPRGQPRSLSPREEYR
jgi:hypothetical protein